MSALREKLIDNTVSVDGDLMKIINVGAVVDGKAYLHLESTTRVLQRAKNGVRMVQFCDWFDLDEIEANSAITQFYGDRQASGLGSRNGLHR